MKRFFAVGQYTHGKPSVYSGFAGDSTVTLGHATGPDFIPTEPGRHLIGSSARHFSTADVVCYVEDEEGCVPMPDGKMLIFDDMYASAVNEAIQEQEE